MPSEGYMLSVVPIVAFVAMPLVLWTIWIIRRSIKQTRRKAHYQKRLQRQLQRKHQNMIIHSGTKQNSEVFSIGGNSKTFDSGVFEFGYVEDPVTRFSDNRSNSDSANSGDSGKISGTSSICRICEVPHKTLKIKNKKTNSDSSSVEETTDDSIKNQQNNGEYKTIIEIDESSA